MNAMKVNNKILKTVRYATGNKCRALSNGVIWQNLLYSNTRREAELRFLVIEYFFAKVFTGTYPDDLDPRELVLEAYSELSPTLLVSE